MYYNLNFVIRSTATTVAANNNFIKTEFCLMSNVIKKIKIQYKNVYFNFLNFHFSDQIFITNIIVINYYYYY